VCCSILLQLQLLKNKRAQPLCPDALTPFCRLYAEKDRESFDQRARGATEFLIDQIKATAQELVDIAKDQKSIEFQNVFGNFSAALHSRGINVRFFFVFLLYDPSCAHLFRFEKIRHLGMLRTFCN
jgi:hypothetical protein